jgi:protein O-GlcNAc transferase
MSADAKRLALEELQKGLQRMRVGDISRARSHFQRAVKLDSQNADAWHSLGIVQLQLGVRALAIKAFRTSVELRPSFADAHNELGKALLGDDKASEAIRSFQNALRFRENHVDAKFHLSRALESIGELTAAERGYRQTLAMRSNHVEAMVGLGNLLRRTQRFPEAIAMFESARHLSPADASIANSHARALCDAGRSLEAVAVARNAVALQADNSENWTTLGAAQRQIRDNDSAIESFRHAIKLDQSNSTTTLELAYVLYDAGDTEAARTAWKTTRAPAGLGERVRWMHALSLPAIYRDNDDVDEARRRFADGLSELNDGLKLDSKTAINAAVDAASSVAPFFLHYQPRDNTELQCQFGDLVTRVITRAAPRLVDACDWTLRSRNRTRVGIVSAHLMDHTVSRYFRTMIAGLDRQRFEVHVWYTGGTLDASTAAIAANVDSFVDTRIDVLSLAHEIRAAKLDVLVYPEIGMDSKHQALASLRLAPIQCALYGHPATSGLANVDYFLSGDAIEPANAQSQYRERLIRLPGIGARPSRPPPIGDGTWYEETARERPVLLCTQNFIKLIPDFDNVLAKIAAETGVCIGFFARNPLLMRRFRDRIENVFVSHGLNAERHLTFIPAKKHEDYLAGLAKTPMVLDSPWFSGGATSLDAIHVGTPIVAWEGTMLRGRQTAAMLTLIGLSESVALNEGEYVNTCVALLRDNDRRAAIREATQARQSILFDDDRPVKAFAEFLENVEPR